MRKNTRLSLHVQLQCFRSGAKEPGNEATVDCRSHTQVVFVMTGYQREEADRVKTKNTDNILVVRTTEDYTRLLHPL